MIKDWLIKNGFPFLVVFLVVFFTFIYWEFPAAWNEPVKSLGLAKVHLILAVCVYFIGVVVKKQKQALSVSIAFLSISGFYFLIFLIKSL